MIQILRGEFLAVTARLEDLQIKFIKEIDWTFLHQLKGTRHLADYLLRKNIKYTQTGKTKGISPKTLLKQMFHAYFSDVSKPIRDNFWGRVAYWQ